MVIKCDHSTVIKFNDGQSFVKTNSLQRGVPVKNAMLILINWHRLLQWQLIASVQTHNPTC